MDIKFIMAIDPGTFNSAIVTWDGRRPLAAKKWANGKVRSVLRQAQADERCGCALIIEKIVSYGNCMGQTTIDTAVWSGVFQEAWERGGGVCFYVPRRTVRKHICNNGNAKDPNIIQALADRFAYGEKNKGKGTKAKPGFFFGFKEDIWQAFALAVTWWDQNMCGEDAS